MYFEILDICTKAKKLYDTTNDSDGFVYQPSLLTLDKYKEIIIRAYTFIPKGPVPIEIWADGSGGIIAEWKESFGHNEIRLHLSSNPVPKSDYLYTVIDGQENVENEINSEKLVECLNKLTKAIDTK